MLCRLCLLDCDDLLEIFDQKGRRLQISSIVAQHFGLQLRYRDQISNKICTTCWLEIENFHAFYVDVQQAQGKLEDELAKNSEPDPDLDSGNEEVDNQEYHDPDGYTDLSDTEDEVGGDDGSFRLPNCDTQLSRMNGKDMSNISGDIDVFAAPSRTGFVKIKNRKSWKPSKKKSLIDSNRINTRPHNVIVVDINTPDVDKKFPANYLMKNSPHFNNKQTEDDVIRNSLKSLTKILQRKELSITAMPKITSNATSKEDEQEISKYIKLNCELCATQFNIFSDLKHHFRTVHNIVGYVVCCNEKLFKRVHLLDHVMKHLDRSRFTKNPKKPRFDNMHVKKCPLCRKIFKTKRYLDHHMKEHKIGGKKSSRNQCQQCGLWFKNRYSLHKHIRSHVDRNQSHICTICGKKSISDIALHRHLNNVHYKERKYQCNMCDKAFKWSINLREHMAIHTGESLYRCPHCPKTFNAGSNLHSHRKKAHREEWEDERKKRIEMGINEKISIELE